MMKVKKIEWTSFSSKEAEMIISDGKNECLVFSHPCPVHLGDIISEPLHVMGLKNLMIVLDQSQQESIVKIDTSYFAHYCIARVFDIKEGLVSIGGLIFDIGISVPSWAQEGELVEFECSRLNIW